MKFYSSITVLLFPLLSMAQLKLSVNAGFGNSNLNTNVSTVFIETNNISAYKMGIAIQKYLSKNFFVETGIDYNLKGTAKSRGYQSLYGANSTLKINYLQSPLNIGTTFKLYKDINFIASTGLYFAMGISGSEVGTTKDVGGDYNLNRTVKFTNEELSSNNEYAYIKAIDFGYNLNGGIEYKHFTLMANYGIGFTNISTTGSTNYRNNNLNFSVGYLITIKK